MESEKVIKDIISRVNSTLGYYEKSFISAQRTPDIERERCESFEEYIEIRFNYEAYKVPELRPLLDETEGRLFSCVNLEEPDTAKRRFKTATVKLIDPELLPEGYESLKDEILKVKELIGGSQISFNNVRKKIKFTIDE